jgi:hypothetical protein
MDSQRIASRRRVLKAGSIEVGGDVFECTVRNLSDRGAALEVMTPLYIPDRFTLVLQSEQSKRECRIIWRKQKRIGVTFD